MVSYISRKRWDILTSLHASSADYTESWFCNWTSNQPLYLELDLEDSHFARELRLLNELTERVLEPASQHHQSQGHSPGDHLSISVLLAPWLVEPKNFGHQAWALSQQLKKTLQESLSSGTPGRHRWEPVLGSAVYWSDVNNIIVSHHWNTTPVTPQNKLPSLWLWGTVNQSRQIYKSNAFVFSQSELSKTLSLYISWNVSKITSIFTTKMTK